MMHRHLRGAIASLLCLIGIVMVGPIALGSGQAAAATDAFSITTSPSLDPAFNPAILDYAIRCTTRRRLR